MELAARVLEGVGGAVSAPAPLVNICISAYNAEQFLAETLRSVLGQTHRQIGVIVLDNGSVDGTFAVAQSFDDPRLQVHRVQDNLGAYQAMNRLAAMATADYVAIYHADDVYEPTIVEREVGHLLANPSVGAVFCTDHLMDEDGHIYGGVSLHPSLAGRASLSYDDVVRYLVRRKNTLFCCPTFMVRRDVFRDVGPFRPEIYGIGSDLEMYVRIARQYPVAILDERLIRYRKGRHQWSARYRHERVEQDCFFHVMDEVLARDGWREKLSAADLIEYEFHRGDDATFRAANLVQKGDLGRARDLLRRHPLPWRTFLMADLRRRKARTFALRAMIRGGLALHATQPLTQVLARLGP